MISFLFFFSFRLLLFHYKFLSHYKIGLVSRSGVFSVKSSVVGKYLGKSGSSDLS